MDTKFLPAGPKLVDYVPRSEPWTEYQLEDGSIVRTRTVMVKAHDSGQRDPTTGFPVINFQFQQLIDVTWSESAAAEARAYLDPRRGGE